MGARRVLRFAGPGARPGDDRLELWPVLGGPVCPRRRRRSVISLAAPHERSAVLSVIYVVSHLALGLPAGIGGVLAVYGGGLQRTAIEFGAVVMVLAGMALAGWLLPTRAEYRSLSQPARRRTQHAARSTQDAGRRTQQRSNAATQHHRAWSGAGSQDVRLRTAEAQECPSTRQRR